MLNHCCEPIRLLEISECPLVEVPPWELTRRCIFLLIRDTRGHGFEWHKATVAGVMYFWKVRLSRTADLLLQGFKSTMGRIPGDGGWLRFQKNRQRKRKLRIGGYFSVPASKHSVWFHYMLSIQYLPQRAILHLPFRSTKAGNSCAAAYQPVI